MICKSSLDGNMICCSVYYRVKNTSIWDSDSSLTVTKTSSVSLILVFLTVYINAYAVSMLFAFDLLSWKGKYSELILYAILIVNDTLSMKLVVF